MDFSTVCCLSRLWPPSLPADFQQHTLVVAATKWPGSNPADANIFHQAPVSGFTLLCLPAWSLDHEHPAVAVRERLKPAQQLGQRRNCPDHEGVKTSLRDDLLGRTGMHRHPEVDLTDDLLHGSGALANTLGEFNRKVRP